ncbi:nucleotide-binding alpha-beta plait domain-containing protein [Tanacetum coccineum]
MVLDDIQLDSQWNLSHFLIGRVKEFASLAHLKMTISNEGFTDVKIQYLGEFWVMLEFTSKETMKMFQIMYHWILYFALLGAQTLDFQLMKRIAWVEIEGIPFKLWSSKMCNSIATKWGELLDVDDEEETFGSYKNGKPPKKSVESGDNLISSGHFKKSELPRTGGSILAVPLKSEAVGNSGGQNLLIGVVYAPHNIKEKFMLWDYLQCEITRWKGQVVIMGDFNESTVCTTMSGKLPKPKTSSPPRRSGEGVAIGKESVVVVAANEKDATRVFTKLMKQMCWDLAEEVSGRDPDRWRKDAVGNIVFKGFTKCHGCLCYEYDHIHSYVKGMESLIHYLVTI